MNRTPKIDIEFDRLSDERDHVAIQLSLATDAAGADPRRVSQLKAQLAALETKIARYKLAETPKLARGSMGRLA